MKGATNMRPVDKQIIIPGLSFAVLCVVLISLVGTGVIPGVSASPTRQDPTPPPGDVTNNYYGINCGDSGTPCHVVIDSGPSAGLVITTGTGLALPVYGPTPGVVITTTLPISTTDVPRTWGDGDSVLLLCLLVAIMSKFMVLVIADIAEKNIFVWIYRTLITGIWVAVDILILYPATLRSLDISIYGLWLAVWIFLMILDRAINFFKHLTGGRG